LVGHPLQQEDSLFPRYGEVRAVVEGRAAAPSGWVGGSSSRAETTCWRGIETAGHPARRALLACARFYRPSEALAAERRRLQGLGIALGDDIPGDYSTLAQLRDPDGNLITLATPPVRPSRRHDRTGGAKSSAWGLTTACSGRRCAPPLMLSVSAQGLLCSRLFEQSQDGGGCCDPPCFGRNQ
jgi:hypothetical protein